MVTGATGGIGPSNFGIRGLHAVLEQELRGTGVCRRRRRCCLADAVAVVVLYALTRPPEMNVPTIAVQRS